MTRPAVFQAQGLTKVFHPFATEHSVLERERPLATWCARP